MAKKIIRISKETCVLIKTKTLLHVTNLLLDVVNKHVHNPEGKVFDAEISLIAEHTNEDLEGGILVVDISLERVARAISMRAIASEVEWAFQSSLGEFDSFTIALTHSLACLDGEHARVIVHLPYQL